MSVYWDEGRKNMEDFCRGAKIPSTGQPSPFNYLFQPDPDDLLRVSVALSFRRAKLQYVYLILRGKDLESGDFSEARRDDQFERLKEAQAYALDYQNWHEYFKALQQAGYRRSETISSKVALIYCYTLFLIGKRDFKLDAYELRTLIARWFFMAALTSRYSSSPESQMEGELARLRGLQTAAEFKNHLDQEITKSLTEDFWNIELVGSLDKALARNPALYAYYAALNLQDAKGLFSKIKIRELLEEGVYAKKSALEMHHLFPKNYLKTELSLTDRHDTNQIANYALVEWNDNIKISDDPPAVYWPKYAARFSQEELVQMCAWHALPEGWESMEYSDFLVGRRHLIAKAIRAGFQSIG